MKKLLLLAACAGLLFTACKKKSDSPTPTPTPTKTNPLAGTWTVVLLDNAPLPTGQSATYTVTASTDSTGSGNFDLNNGSGHMTEDATFVLSSGNTHAQFTKTGGNWDITSGASGAWTIDTLTSSVLRMTNSTGLIVRCTK